ncbi:HD-GYP domain-containing protein [Helicovermis profundi]|uniref:HD-GYP domain-containing protein n=1 Tax=Helicovermis profundi TaxID=3065157 RepID=A0AAU9E699_9FIRM|nr:HD-GYP domain-containing protein [Clostridia bacterium S502]
MRAIPTSYVKETHKLGETLYTLNSGVLVRYGAILTKELVKQIEDQNIFTVYIIDEHSDYEVNSVISQQLRQRGNLLVKELFDAVSKRVSFIDIHKKIYELSDDILYEVSSVRNDQIEYVDIKKTDNYLYTSSFNTALLSVLLGWSLKLKRDQLKDLFIGAIYHDIGLALIPKAVVNKTEKLTIDEQKMIIMHPKRGYELLKDLPFISSHTKSIVFQHHEHIDGSGYPSRTKGSNVSILSQIVGLSDIYDAMVSDKPYKRASTPSEAIEYIMGVADRHFKFEIVNEFIKKINPFPAGSLIELNTGEKAVVDFVPKQLPLRPKIRIINKSIYGINYTEVDLSEETNLVIKKMIYSID